MVQSAPPSILVGGLNPSEKYESDKMIIPNKWENKRHVPVTTNQSIYCIQVVIPIDLCHGGTELSAAVTLGRKLCDHVHPWPPWDGSILVPKRGPEEASCLSYLSIATLKKIYRKSRFKRCAE